MGGAPGPGTGGGMGIPTDAGPGVGGLPVLPGQDPYDIDRYGTVSDPSDWQLWWNFNRDRFLQFSGIQTGESYTGSDGFYLGRGEAERSAIGGRAEDSVIDGPLADAVKAGLMKGGSVDFVKSGLVAMAKIGGEHKDHYAFTTNWMVANGTAPVQPAAAFLLGLSGGHKDVAKLREIALNTKKGSEYVSPKDGPVTARIPMSVRAHAAYGLGMIGSRSPDEAVRQDIVKTLIEVLEDSSAEANDARVAAMVALGLVPLAVDEDVVACYCGTCVVPDPHTSLRAQVTYLLRYFTAAKEFDPILRAHTATTLGRLVAARPNGMTERMKEGVAEVLVRSLDRSSKQPDNVRESAVLALGLIGDADEGNVDRWIRWAISRSIKSGGDMEKRFALISLAEIGSHKGQGDEPFGALPDIRSKLRNQLSSGNKRVRPWAALATGVLGFELRSKGVELDPKVDSALNNAIRSGKRLDDLGAYALAAGMRGMTDATDRMVGKLEKVRDEATAGYVAVGLGMIGERALIPTLQEQFEESEGKPLLQTRLGLALGLLGDSEVASELLMRLEDAEEEAEKVAVITALGYIGDKRGVDVLGEFVADAKSSFEDPIREAAIVALGYVGDRMPRPWRTKLTLGSNYRARTATLTTGEGEGVLDLK